MRRAGWPLLPLGTFGRREPLPGPRPPAGCPGPRNMQGKPRTPSLPEPLSLSGGGPPRKRRKLRPPGRAGSAAGGPMRSRCTTSSVAAMKVSSSMRVLRIDCTYSSSVGHRPSSTTRSGIWSGVSALSLIHRKCAASKRPRFDVLPPNGRQQRGDNLGVDPILVAVCCTGPRPWRPRLV